MDPFFLKIIITGATGMVGEGVLHVCLAHPAVGKVLVINRKPCGVSHAKLEEVLHDNFFDLSPVEKALGGYDACFFCLGVSSVGMKEEAYYRQTYTLTMEFARALCRHNPFLRFCYVSGAGTDSSEKGRIMWARVKGKTENDLMKLPFEKVYAYRPGFIKPIRGLQHSHPYYKYISWLFPFGRKFYPKGFCTLEELGLSMIHVVQRKYDKNILEGQDIIRTAREET